MGSCLVATKERNLPQKGVTKMKPDSDTGDIAKEAPVWHAYVFTACMFLALIALLATMGYISRIPYFEPFLFGVCTIAAICTGIWKPTKSTAVWSHLVLATFLLLACYANIQKAELILASAYGLMAGAWIALAAIGFWARRRFTKERLAKLDRVVSTLGRAQLRPEDEEG